MDPLNGNLHSNKIPGESSVHKSLWGNALHDTKVAELSAGSQAFVAKVYISFFSYLPDVTSHMLTDS